MTPRSFPPRLRSEQQKSIDYGSVAQTNKFLSFIYYALTLTIFKGVASTADIFSVEWDGKVTVSKGLWPIRRGYPDIRWQRLNKPMTNTDDVSPWLDDSIKHITNSTDRSTWWCHTSEGRITQHGGHLTGKVRFDTNRGLFFSRSIKTSSETHAVSYRTGTGGS